MFQQKQHTTYKNIEYPTYYITSDYKKKKENIKNAKLIVIIFDISEFLKIK